MEELAMPNGCVLVGQRQSQWTTRCGIYKHIPSDVVNLHGRLLLAGSVAWLTTLPLFVDWSTDPAITYLESQYLASARLGGEWPHMSSYPGLASYWQNALSSMNAVAPRHLTHMLQTVVGFLEERWLDNGPQGNAIVAHLPLLVAGAHGLLIGHLLLLSLVHQPLKPLRMTLCAAYAQAQRVQRVHQSSLSTTGGQDDGGRSWYKPEQVRGHLMKQCAQCTASLPPGPSMSVRAHFCFRYTAKTLAHAPLISLEQEEFLVLLREIPIWCGELSDLHRVIPGSDKPEQTEIASSSQNTVPATPAWLQDHNAAILHLLTCEGYVAVLVLDPSEGPSTPRGRDDKSLCDALLTAEIFENVVRAPACTSLLVSPGHVSGLQDGARSKPWVPKGQIPSHGPGVHKTTSLRNPPPPKGHIAALWWQLMDFLELMAFLNPGFPPGHLAQAVETAWFHRQSKSVPMTLWNSSVEVERDFAMLREGMLNPQRLIDCALDGFKQLLTWKDRSARDERWLSLPLRHVTAVLSQRCLSLHTVLWQAFWHMPSRTNADKANIPTSAMATLSPTGSTSSSLETSARPTNTAMGSVRAKAKAKPRAKAKAQGTERGNARGKVSSQTKVASLPKAKTKAKAQPKARADAKRAAKVEVDVSSLNNGRAQRDVEDIPTSKPLYVPGLTNSEDEGDADDMIGDERHNHMDSSSSEDLDKEEDALQMLSQLCTHYLDAMMLGDV